MDNKEKITISIDPEMLEWIDKNVANKRFGSRSHAFEYLVWNAKKKE